MTCKNSTDSGCMCAEHHLGLLAFTVNEHHHQSLARALDHLREPQTEPVKVSNVVQLVQCDHSMTCSCVDCERDRSRRVKAGVRRSDPFGGMPVKIRKAA